MDTVPPAYRVAHVPSLGPVLDLRDLRDIPLPAAVRPPVAVRRRYAADGWTITRYVVEPQGSQSHLARYLLVAIEDGAGRSAGIAVNSPDSPGGRLDGQTLDNLGLPGHAHTEMHYPGPGRVTFEAMLATLLDLNRWLAGIDPAEDPAEYDAALLGLTRWATSAERSWAQVQAWRRHGVATPFRLRLWRSAGFTDAEIRQWAPLDPGGIKARVYMDAFVHRDTALAWFQALPDLSPGIAAAVERLGWGADALARPLSRAVAVGATLPQPSAAAGESLYDAAVSALVPYAQAGLAPDLAVACLTAGISSREAAVRHAEGTLDRRAVAALAALRTTKA